MHLFVYKNIKFLIKEKLQEAIYFLKFFDLAIKNMINNHIFNRYIKRFQLSLFYTSDTKIFLF